MYEDCSNAQEAIEFEQYILEADDLGIRFIKLFIEKLKQGVTVTMLCDALGSRTMVASLYPAELKKHGGKIHFYHPIGIKHARRLVYWFFRDHRKILVVDSRIAYTGGVGFDSKMANWRDTHIRITGPVVSEIQQAFRNLWNKTHKKHRLFVTKGVNPPGAFHYYSSNPKFRKNIIYEYLLEAIRQAKDYVYLTTPYFIPSYYFFKILRQAAERGVCVILLVPNQVEHIFVYRVAESYFGKALLSGVRVLQYDQDILHTKSIIIDDRWATMGSMNLDYLSFYRNVEANLIITEPDAIAELKHHFLTDLEESWELTYVEWKSRPFWQKAMGYMGRIFKKFM